MASVFLDMAISLDGFIAGSNDEDPGLYDWYFAPAGNAVAVIDELLGTIGAMVLGKRAFGEQPDGFDTPYKVPHFVLTHTPRPTIRRDGATFSFVADGLESAIRQAQAAANGKDVCVAGGANTAQQCLNAGLLDEIRLHLVPVLLGSGVRLFENLDQRMQLERTLVIESPGATHLRFKVVK